MSKIKIEKPTKEQLENLNVKTWSSWGCEVSSFDWEYDAEETCYIMEGHVRVETADGDVEIKAGDLVTFPKGLKCKWHVSQPIRKVFRFD